MTRRMKTALVQLIQLHSNNCRDALDREAFKEDYRQMVIHGPRSLVAKIFYGLTDRAELAFWWVTAMLLFSTMFAGTLVPVNLFTSSDLSLLVVAGIALMFWGRLFQPSHELLAEASEVLREVRAELSSHSRAGNEAD